MLYVHVNMYCCLVVSKNRLAILMKQVQSLESHKVKHTRIFVFECANIMRILCSLAMCDSEEIG